MRMRLPGKRATSMIALVLAVAGSATALAGPASGRRATGWERPRELPVLRSNAQTAIAGRYIVALREGVEAIPGGTRRAELMASVRSLGGVVDFEYSTALNGFAGTLPERALQALRRHPDVAFIEADQTVTAQISWGQDRIDQLSLPLDGVYQPNFGNGGAGVDAYVLDTGIRLDHVDFGGRAVTMFDAFGRDGSDCNGHGTHIAGIVGGQVYGVAPMVRLHSVRVLDCTGSGSVSGILAGADEVVRHHQSTSAPGIAVMALGGGPSRSLDTIVQGMVDAGIPTAVAAGNGGADACNFSPARSPNVMTVGAMTITDNHEDRRWAPSNHGSCVNFYAPGTNITSNWHTSSSATRTMTGTSTAVAFVAGVGALHLAAGARVHEFIDPWELMSLLEFYSIVTGDLQYNLVTPMVTIIDCLEDHECEQDGNFCSGEFHCEWNGLIPHLIKSCVRGEPPCPPDVCDEVADTCNP